MITTRRQFVERRNSYYNTMQMQLRQGQHEQRVGASGAFDEHGAMARYERMEADYPAICEVSALKSPTQVDFDRAEMLINRHGA